MRGPSGLLPVVLPLFLLLLPSALIAQTGPGSAPASEPLEAFGDAVWDWGPGLEAIIENAYRRCFRTFIVSGRIVTLRMPFAQQEERSELAGTNLDVAGGGKADPLVLWELVDAALQSPDFLSYVAALEDGFEKVVTFDLRDRSWSTSRTWADVDTMRASIYRGLPHLIRVLERGRGITAPSIYNYLYCVARVGMDCSGFVWSVLKAIGQRGGVDLDRIFRRYLGAPSSDSASFYVGTSFFDPRHGNTDVVEDNIRNLIPGDVLGFRGSDGELVHTAVIQSVDLAAGRIRYLQSTDEAPQGERGVHESVITFDPSQPSLSIKDPSVTWHQKVAAPFVGEDAGTYRTDGERFHAHPEVGAGIVVRLRALRKAIEAIRGQEAGRS